ncbi:LacI family transcriptional regulator [Prolixibacteraceae bacterium JC049]|nr:LacI family transcriptional regulator [Prolixibacteraceae bacterium JC049]
MKKKHLSLKDLASELKVSISTVSRALKNHPDISPEMTKKVQALARKRNYTPNPLAMGLLRQQTKMIGVIVPDMVTQFFSSIISGIEHVAKQRGYYIIISSSYDSFQKERECVENLLQTRVEGIIMSLSSETKNFPHLRPLIDRELPLVLFDRVALTDKVSSVVVNDRESTRKIALHFYNQGYRRIAFISGASHLQMVKERANGYWEAIREVGLPEKKEYFVECNMTQQSAAQAMMKLLRLPEPPDAVCGVSHTATFGALKAIRNGGLTIPNEIAVAGFADQFHAELVTPNLTSIHHPTFEIGREAARLFFERLENPSEMPVQVVLNTQLVPRGSSLK